MHAGRASQSGLYGALLAKDGFTGIPDVLESEYGGFCTTFSRSQDRFRLAELTAGLGETWQTMGVALKFYACVGSNHTALDALRELQAGRPFGPKDVKRIVVRCSRVTLDHAGWKYRPAGIAAAQMNLAFCIATLLLEGDCFVGQFGEKAPTDRARIALAGKVEVLEDPEITAWGSKHRHAVRVEVELGDGSILKHGVETPRGSEPNFASEAQVVAKFEKLAGHALGRAQLARLRDSVLGMDKLKDASRIAKLMTRGAR
jgi:2-methylcitrate dehydratase PrpD